ncbi:MAG: cytochrome c [Saprospiraceae bacterium]|nr:cytochrome c [Saprospiraceae bacterium]
MKPFLIYISLCACFLGYSASLYQVPAEDSAILPYDKPRAAEGRLVWQRYNCQSCHQLYGLGGYLGPDLTNVYSAPGKGEAWIRAVTASGNTLMPKYNFTEQEMEDLLVFLRATDHSGKADPRSFDILPNGMTRQK